MRNLLVVLVFILAGQLTYGQETNASLLNKAKADLEIAVGKEDYETASKLKKEIELRKQIEEAAKNEDFELAAKLKGQLNAKENVVKETEEKEASNVQADYRFPEPKEGKAIVEFVKVTAQGWNAETFMFDGDKYIGSVWGVSHMRVEVDPGKHLFWMNITDKVGYLEANVEAGKVYVVIMDMAATAFSNVGLSPATMDNRALVDRAKRVIYKHPVKVTPGEKINKTQNKLDKKGYITRQLTKYEKKYKSTSKTKILSPEMDVPLDYLRQ